MARKSGPAVRVPGAAFLLALLGGQSSRIWASRLEAVGMEPREVMLLRQVGQAAGRSQQDIARSIGLPASRVVELVDRLESKGWVERRTVGADRRRRELHITAAGRAILDTIRAVSVEHELAITRALGAEDRERLIELLERLADAEGLLDRVPGFGDRAPSPPPKSGRRRG